MRPDAEFAATLQAVQMEAESGCSRCDRRILTLEKGFLDENYAAVCVHCAAAMYTIISRLRHSPGDDAASIFGDDE